MAVQELQPPQPRLPHSSYLYPSPLSESAAAPVSPRSMPIASGSAAPGKHEPSPRHHRESISKYNTPPQPSSNPDHPHHPILHRSDTAPQIPAHRPIAFRTNTSLSPVAVKMSPGSSSGEFVINNPVGSARQAVHARDEDDREDLTTKGKKRKRLAKACSACHKNKRRCDGFAPCSNCEFSSRACLYINAQGEVIPPPRTRESVVKKDVSADGTPNGMSGSASGEPANGDGAGPSPDKRADGVDPPPGHERKTPRKEGDKAEKEPRGYVDGLEAVDRDISFSAELLDIFFQHVHPYAAMLHAPTFNYRLFLGRTSPLLLDAIYALSAHLSTNPTFLATLPPNTPQWARGEIFADRAQHSAKHLLELRASWPEESRRQDRGTWEETEFVQALYLLSVYYASIRQSNLGLFFLDKGIEILRPNSTASLTPPPTHLGLSTIDYLTLLECRNRTFWMLVLHDLCAAANGRPRRLMDHELYNVPLPGDENQWDRWGGGGSSGREGSKRDCLALGTGNWLGEEGLIGEFGHVLRVLVVFCDIMTVANNGGSGNDNRNAPAHHEQALKTWALSLPRHMRFDENTLTAAVARLNSPVPTISRSGWLFAYMHAVAECGMFYLQAALATNGASWTAQRQAQAVDNIAVILEAIGSRGRASPLMLFPLLVVSNWHEHLRSSPAAPTPQQMLLNQRLSLWWSDSMRDWGFERQATTERGFYADKLHPPSPLPPSASSLGLYSISPSRPPESALSMSSSSITTLPTPVTSGVNGLHRFSVPSLAPHPPVRQRANTLAYAPTAGSSPPSHRRGLPSMSSVSGLSEMATGPRNEIRLPPLPPTDPSPNGSSVGGFKFPSYWLKDGEDRSRQDRDRSNRARSPSPLSRPWARDRHERVGSRYERTSPTHADKAYRLPSPGLAKSWEGGAAQSKRAERTTEVEAKEGESGPVGIAALISAAEAKSQEERHEREQRERMSV